ncbi:MAG: hypothetical protein ACLGI6_03325 [Gammaproteobacteria bacterium]
MAALKDAVTHAAMGMLLGLSSWSTMAANQDFSGRWSADLRTRAQRASKLDCGAVSLVLDQQGDRITGSYTFASVGCGRVNEGRDGSVKGVAKGSTAVLVITSARNGAMVLGTATRRGKWLQWNTVEELTPGQPQGDTLILDQGTLAQDVAGTP